MAFANRSENTSNNANTGNQSWKAQGFLNLYLPSKEAGKRIKLGAIPLKESRNNEKALLEWLKADPANIEKLVGKLEVEFKTAEPANGSSLDLG